MYRIKFTEEKLKLEDQLTFYYTILRVGSRMKINVHGCPFLIFYFSCCFFQDPLVHLSEDVIARTYNIFAIMFRYAVEILTWEKESELPADLEMV